MGLGLAIFTFLIGLFFLLFPGFSAKIFRFGGGGVSYNNLGTLKEKGKWKVGLTPSTEQYFGKEKAVLFFRIAGIIFIILSIPVYIFSP
jgi:hypothetical protein